MLETKIRKGGAQVQPAPARCSKSFPRWHSTLRQRCINVETTSWHCFDVNVTLYKRHLPVGLLLGCFFSKPIRKGSIFGLPNRIMVYNWSPVHSAPWSARSGWVQSTNRVQSAQTSRITSSFHSRVPEGVRSFCQLASGPLKLSLPRQKKFLKFRRLYYEPQRQKTYLRTCARN